MYERLDALECAIMRGNVLKNPEFLSNFKKVLIAVNLALILFASLYSESSATILDNNSYSIIKSYERIVNEFSQRNGVNSFVDALSTMIHVSEGCYDEKAFVLNCRVPLTKRESDFSFAIIPGNFTEKQKKIDAIQVFLGRFQRLVGHITSIKVLKSNKIEEYNQVRILVITKNEMISLRNRVRFPELIDNMTGNRNLDCTGGIGKGSSGEISIAAIYINADLPVNKIIKCISEEVYNTMGLLSDPFDYPSLYDEVKINMGINNYGLPYSDLDIVRLAILYTKNMRVGQSIDQSKSIISMMIEELSP